MNALTVIYTVFLLAIKCTSILKIDNGGGQNVSYYIQQKKAIKNQS